VQPIAEWHDVDSQTFHEQIVTRYRPAVLRGVIREWPAVRAGLESSAAVAGFLAALDSGEPVDAILMPPAARGRIAYNDAMDGFNFARKRVPLSSVLEQLSRYALFDDPPSVAVQSALIDSCLPGFAAQHPMPLLDAAVAPRIWLGNRVTVPAHFDESFNLACVIAGRRRFTLFAPEEVGNLYIGPLDFAPTGAAMSLVDLTEPDLAKYPRARDALAAASTAVLEPGDAIFIPALWWHQVESLDPELNALVNYWWNGTLDGAVRTPSGMDSLLHSVINIGPMPSELRDAWSALFRHYVFEPTDELAAHIPEHKRGVLGHGTDDAKTQIRKLLIAKLQRDLADRN
jgi:hypothetical protein